MIENEQKKEETKEGNLFSKKEWDSLIQWSPVAKDPYNEVDEKIKKFHDDYIKLWKITESER